jgi:signal transduction histidine kinase
MKSFADIVRLPHPVRQPTDVKELLGRICSLMKAECEKRNIVLERRLDSMNGSVAEIDAHQMEQVFVNILQNAIDAVGGDGRIVVQLSEGERGTVVMIEDSGPGISPDVRQMLFTPFFSTKENGQGIGLTLVQEILSQHGFEYSLESRPGEMTKFTVNLG